MAPTTELRATLAALEQLHGPVVTILLPTSSGLEHKLPMPALAQFSLSADTRAKLWVTPGQWSFPISLPPSWLGFPPGLKMSGAQSGQEKAPASIGPAATLILFPGAGTFSGTSNALA